MLVTQVVEQLKTLPDNLQQEVLAFVHNLQTSSAKGISGKQLIKFVGLIPSDDLKVMREAIEAGCEQIDPNEW